MDHMKGSIAATLNILCYSDEEKDGLGKYHNAGSSDFARILCRTVICGRDDESHGVRFRRLSGGTTSEAMCYE